MNKYPNWVCVDCGRKALAKEVGSKSKMKRMLAGRDATFHEDKCDVCQEVKPVTQPRDYAYPPLEDFEFKQ